MPRKQMSGYCRSTVFFLIVILALCFTAASAASLSDNLVVSRVTQTLQIPATIVPVHVTCPAGYSCMTDADATAQLGSYAKYSEAVCGYRQSTATMAAAIQIPQYCVKKVETQNPVSCPQGCSCLLESDAKAKFGSFSRCSDTPCNTVVTGSARLNAFCVRQGTTTTTPPAATCPEGCTCISGATAEAKGGSWKRCSEKVCGYEQSTATLAAVANVPKYCMIQQSTTPAPVVCSEGCYCIQEAGAQLKFGLNNYTQCSSDICGYDPSATTANGIPKYCFKPIGAVSPISTVCPQGCYCLQEAEANLKFGPNNYTRCQADICGNDPSATSANGIPRYCFKPTITVMPVQSVCSQGCTCTTNSTAVEKGLSFCGGKLTSCGYYENKQPQYCFQQVPSPTCVYDYQKNVCTGTCGKGFTCGLLASEKDATGKVTYGVCGCTGQPTTACAYDSQKNACTGTCQSGTVCSVVGKKVDQKTGESYPVCGCPQSSCTYNYDKETCVGSCITTGDTCQLNTIYRDPTTGKVTYAECHCKGGGETTASCACDAASGSCTGTCADGKACSTTGRATDNAGRVTCKSCGCVDTCVLDTNNRCSGTCSDGSQCTSITTRDDNGQVKVSCSCGSVPTGKPSGVVTPTPGILEAITSFFSKLFGGK